MQLSAKISKGNEQAFKERLLWPVLPKVRGRYVENIMKKTSRLDLLGPAFVEAFDRLTQLIAKLLDTPVALFSIVDVDNNRQYFKSFQGLPEPWADKRETPLSHSFCQHVRYFSRALVVEDAREHDVLRHNLAVRDLDVIAYLGFPIYDDTNEAIGSLCAIDSKPRKWNEDQIECMRSLAATLNEILRQQAEVEAQKAEIARLDTSLTKSEATLKTREQFFAFMCHELRTPLSGILAGSRLADHLIENSLHIDRLGVGKTLKIINSSAQSMNRTVDEILDLSKLESGIFDVNPAPFDLHKLIEDITRMHRNVADEKGISLDLDWNLPADLQQRIGDDHRLQQVLQNLLSNAIRFTEKGGVNLNVSGDEKCLRIEVSDSGEGMAREQLDRLFAPFRQADGETSRRKGGSGLGMAIVDRIVQAMDGRVEARSDPGAGTSVTLFLPISALGYHQEKPALSAANLLAVAAPLKGRKMLVIEPNAVSRALSIELLEGLGATVHTASTPEEAIATALSPYVDSVLVDLGDADINGLEIIKICRATEGKSDLPRLHAVALLATKDGKITENVQASGFNSYVLRPLSRSALVDGLEKATPPQKPQFSSWNMHERAAS